MKGLKKTDEIDQSFTIKAYENEDNLNNHVLYTDDDSVVKQEPLGDDKLDFHFYTDRNMELDNDYDVLDKEGSHLKEELFDGAVADLVSAHITHLDDGAIESPQKKSKPVKKKYHASKLQLPVRTTPRHYVKMFEYFEANRGLATGQLQKLLYRKKWKELTNLLNSEGLGEKSTEKWQKTWSDYKLHLRKKISALRNNMDQTEAQYLFTELEERALKIVGLSLDEESIVESMKRRFNPKDIDSSSQTQYNANNLEERLKKRNRDNLLRKKQIRNRRALARKKNIEIQKQTLKEMKLLRRVVDKELVRVGDALEKIMERSNNNFQRNRSDN